MENKRTTREYTLSVIIPNHNKAGSLHHCLEALAASVVQPGEVIVVDDASTDDSAAVVRRFVCRLVRLPQQAGAARARNVGAGQARGDILFFIDSDCLVEPDTLGRVLAGYGRSEPGVVLGGTYTPRPFDRGFHSFFQSVFIHHCETANLNQPDYLATHALVIKAAEFRKNGGFAEDFLPILEDVEFSHRLRRAGYRLRMDPDIRVRHDFGYDLSKSLANGVRKARYWTAYSIGNRDLLRDSGTASRELKANTVIFGLLAMLGAGTIVLPAAITLAAALVLLPASVLNSRALLRSFFKAGGPAFGLAAAGYYLFVYPMAVAAGGLGGLITYLLWKKDGTSLPHARPREEKLV